MIKNIKLLLVLLLIIVSCKNNVSNPDDTNNVGSNTSSSNTTSDKSSSNTSSDSSSTSTNPSNPTDTEGDNDNASDSNTTDNVEIQNATIIIEAKSLKNINMRSAEGFLNWFTPTYTDIKDYAYFTYGIAATAYTGTFNNFVYLVSLKPNGASIFDRPSSLEKIGINSSKDFANSQQEFILNNINTTDTYIELGSDIRKYNTLSGYVDTDNFGRRGGSGVVASKDNNKVRLKYDKDKKQFVVYNDSMRSINNIMSFTLSEGEKKDISITYKFNGQKKEEETIEVVYTIEFRKN